MSPLEGLIILLVIGAVAAFVAGRRVRDYGFGFVGNIAVGVCGASFGVALLTQLGFGAGSAAGWLIDGTLGAAVLLVLIGIGL